MFLHIYIINVIPSFIFTNILSILLSGVATGIFNVFLMYLPQNFRNSTTDGKLSNVLKSAVRMWEISGSNPNPFTKPKFQNISGVAYLRSPYSPLVEFLLATPLSCTAPYSFLNNWFLLTKVKLQLGVYIFNPTHAFFANSTNFRP